MRAAIGVTRLPLGKSGSPHFRTEIVDIRRPSDSRGIMLAANLAEVTDSQT